MNNGFYGFPNILGLLRATNIKVLGKAGATAGAGLAGGTTSGAPTLGQFDVGEAVIDQTGALWICTVAGGPGTFVQAGFANPLSTKADVLVGGAAGAASRLGVGSDNQVLTADSTQTLGLKWAVTAANAGGALTQIAQTVLGAAAASVTFSSIPGTYSALLLLWAARSDAASSNRQAISAQLNGDSGTTYDEVQTFWGSSTASGDNRSQSNMPLGWIPASSSTSGYVGTGRLQIVAYAGTTFNKGWQAEAQCRGTNSTTDNYLALNAGQWRNTAAVTSIVLSPASGNFLAGSTFTLYGLS